jgi:Zn-dependent protease
MGSPISLGTIFGVHVRIDPTMLFAFVYLLIQGSSGGTQGILDYLTYGVFLFLSVFLHECGHAVGAYLFGIRTLDVTLHFFGGYARLSRPPRTRLAEVVVSFGGPAANLLIAGLLYLWLDAGIDNFRLAWFAGVIAYANWFLALFNLLPGYPLDGGSITRAVLSNWMPDVRARLIVAYIGVIIGLGLAALGLPGQDTWMIMLGLLLVLQASMEVQAAKRWM